MAMRRIFPADANIFLILIGLTLAFELLGWGLLGQSFIFNTRRLPIIVLQVAVVGIIAVGATQVIITSGIDLSSGSVAALSAMVAASFAQTAGGASMYFAGVSDLPAIVPLLAGIAAGCAAGWVNGAVIAYTGVPPFVPTLGMMVSARGLAVLYNNGNPVIGLSDGFTALGAGLSPILIFAAVALTFHVLLTRTLYGRRTYAIGSNEQAARTSGINVRSHKVLVYTIAGGLAGLAGVVMCAKATMAQPGMGLMYELDAISAAVIGGTSLFGGRGSIAGTVLGVLILGVVTSGFTFLRIDFYYQEIAKGLIVLGAVIADRYRQGEKFGLR